MNFKQMVKLYKEIWRELPDALSTISFLIISPFLMPLALLYNLEKKWRKK